MTNIAGLDISPPRVIGTGTYPPGATYGPREMREFALIWLIEGNAVYRWGDETFDVRSEAMVLCRAGATDSFRWDPDLPTRHGYLHFDVNSYPDPWPDREWPVVRQLQPGEDDILRPMFRHLIEWGETGDPVRSTMALGALLAAFVTGEIAGGRIPVELPPPAIDRALSWLSLQLDQKPDAAITLAAMASAACVTSEYLCRLFKATTGRSPMETVRLARLDRAAMLVCRSNFPIGDIAEMYGFSSLVQFSQSFKTAYGRSPRAWRQAVLAGETPPHPRLYRNTTLPPLYQSC